LVIDIAQLDHAVFKEATICNNPPSALVRFRD